MMKADTMMMDKGRMSDGGKMMAGMMMMRQLAGICPSQNSWGYSSSHNPFFYCHNIFDLNSPQRHRDA